MFKSKAFSLMLAGLAFGGMQGGPMVQPLQVREQQPTKSRFRSRIPSPAGKPGDKLARLAARRRVGLSTIR